MGLLDDAIRDHLDLKRRRGADPTEIERAEREALGPVRREPIRSEEHALADVEPAAPVAHEPVDTGEHPFDLEPQFDIEPEEPAPAPEERESRRGGLSFFGRRKRAHAEEEPLDEEPFNEAPADEHLAAEEPLVGAGELRGDRYDDRYEVEAYEDEYYEDEFGPEQEQYEAGPPAAGGVRFHPPDELPEEPLRPTAPGGGPPEDLPPSGASDIPTWGGPGAATPPVSGTGAPVEGEAPLAPTPPPPAEEEDMFGSTVEYDVEAGLDETVSGARPPRGRGAAEPPPAAPEPEDEDVLEETPEFLQDTPDHDRLWFEQKPPRDFDFDG